jgi:hypothetical protein
MENINKLKRSEINQELKSKILLFLKDNNIELDWVSNYKQVIYHYINDIKEIPKCYCGKLNNFKSAVVGYRKTCSQECSNKSIVKKEKIINTKLEKYGDKNYNNSIKGKQTKLEKYGDENYNNRKKAFKTNEIRYGSYSPMKNENVIKLGKITKEIRYGNENYNNIEKIKKFWKKVDKSYYVTWTSPEGVTSKQQRLNRFYASTKGGYILKNRHGTFSHLLKSSGVQIYNNYTQEFPKDVNYAYYIKEIQNIIGDLYNQNQLSLF